MKGGTVSRTLVTSQGPGGVGWGGELWSSACWDSWWALCFIGWEYWEVPLWSSRTHLDECLLNMRIEGKKLCPSTYSAPEYPTRNFDCHPSGWGMSQKQCTCLSCWYRMVLLRTCLTLTQINKGSMEDQRGKWITSWVIEGT